MLLAAYVEWTAEEDPAHEEHTEARRYDRSRHGGTQQARQLPYGVIHHLETELLHIAGERLALYCYGFVQLLQGGAAFLAQAVQGRKALVVEKLEGARQLVVEGVEGRFPLHGHDLRRVLRDARRPFDGGRQTLDCHHGSLGGLHRPCGEGSCLVSRQVGQQVGLETLSLP